MHEHKLLKPFLPGMFFWKKCSLLASIFGYILALVKHREKRKRGERKETLCLRRKQRVGIILVTFKFEPSILSFMSTIMRNILFVVQKKQSPLLFFIR